MKKLICFVFVLAVTPALADAVSLTANDEFGTSSFNSPGHWGDGLAPFAGNGYSTEGYCLRTPTTAGNYTFEGGYLIVGGGDGGGANPFRTDGLVNGNCLLNKSPSGTLITVPDLYLDAGYIRDGMGWELMTNGQSPEIFLLPKTAAGWPTNVDSILIQLWEVQGLSILPTMAITILNVPFIGITPTMSIMAVFICLGPPRIAAGLLFPRAAV